MISTDGIWASAENQYPLNSPVISFPHQNKTMDLGGFFKRQIQLGTVTSIPVRADRRWIFVLLLLAAVTAASLHPLVQNPAGSLLLGLVATALFFVSIFLHEYAHAVAARAEGLHVVEIVLHPFGGLTRFAHPPETARSEFRVAIAGPAASFAVSLVFVALLAVSSYAGTDILTLLLFLLALANFMVAVFNLFPGYPLDGGRVLRAYLWKQGRDLDEATLLTGRCGQVIAVGLMLLGMFFVVLRGEYFTGFWAILAGAFLIDSATSIIREVQAEHHILVEEVMSLPVPLSPDSTLQHFVDHFLPMHRRTTFAVIDGSRFLGMLVLDDLKSIGRERWNSILVRDAMRPAARDQFVLTGTAVSDARVLLERNETGTLAVLDDASRIVGLLHRGGIRRRG
jgi:Zn-dependent protease